MTKLWSDDYDYDKLVEKYSEDWKKNSRASRYRFVHNNAPRKLSDILNEYDISSVLDYGSGYSTYVNHVVDKLHKNIIVVRYDPFVEEVSEKPTTTFDAVVCHNVLGSVEPAFLSAVIEDLFSYSTKLVVLKVAYPSALQNKAEKIIDLIEHLTEWDIREQSIHTAQEYYNIYDAIDGTFSLSDMKYVYYLLEKTFRG
jgi:hypothetical protein